MPHLWKTQALWIVKIPHLKNIIREKDDIILILLKKKKKNEREREKQNLIQNTEMPRNSCQLARLQQTSDRGVKLGISVWEHSARGH